MSKNYYQLPDKCGYCGTELDSDSFYQNRKLHKYNPNCQSRHNQFLSKMRKAKASKNKFQREFALDLEKKLEAGLITERDADPLLSIVNIKKFLPLLGKPVKKRMEI